MTDVLDNTDFFKKLFAMKEFTDDKIKKYLGLDVDHLMNEVVEEINNNNGTSSSNNKGKMIHMMYNHI